jgi:hypothetical protein
MVSYAGTRKVDDGVDAAQQRRYATATVPGLHVAAHGQQSLGSLPLTRESSDRVPGFDQSIDQASANESSCSSYYDAQAVNLPGLSTPSAVGPTAL